MGLSNWPTVTDDDGSYAVGTVFNKALTDAILASIEADLFSAANPSVTCENIIDEVVAARGSKADLDERLDVAMNDDGTLKAQSGQATVSQVQGIVGQGNWVMNDDFRIWAKGDAVAPTGFTLDTITCARETTEKKVGPMCAALTRAGSDGDLVQDLISTAAMSANGAYFKSRAFTFGCWVKTSVASQARVQIDDGVTTSETSYHTGGGTWEFLATTHTVSASATKLTIGVQVLNSNGDAYISGLTCQPGGIVLTEWNPCPVIYGSVTWVKKGAASVVADNDQWSPARPSIVKDVRLTIVTAPTDASLIVDVNVYNGGWQTMFSTKPTLLTTEKNNSAQPDGTYAYRCIEAGLDDVIEDAQINWDIDQVGSTLPGTDLTVTVRMMQYLRPQESFLLYDDVGV